MAPSAIPKTAPAPAAAAAPSQPSLSRRSSLALPSKPSAPSSDLPQPQDSAAPQRPAAKKRQSMQRSLTSSNDSEAGSPAPSDTEGRSKGTSRSGSGAQRRKIIEQRLNNSIQNGEMPQYCSHCGAIETPTWRRLYVMECEGKPGPLDSHEGEGETIGVEVTEKDDSTGEATKFIVRKSMKKTKDMNPGAGFKDVVVCNPCGLWFNKFRNMRPSDKWGRKSGTRKSKKPKPSEPGMSTDGLEPQSEAFFTDQAAADDGVDDADADGQLDGGATEPMPPPSRRPSANSMQAQQPRRGSGEVAWNASRLDAALARAVQSSPVRFQGSQQSPIEIDELTPKPTRRLLFPSPRREGEVKSLDDNGQVSLRSSPPSAKGSGEKLSLSPKVGLELTFEHTDTNVFEAFTYDKENMAPGLDLDDDELAHLFEGSPTALFKTPRKTPSKATPLSLRHLMKTPTPASRKRKPLTPNRNAANGADTVTNVHDFMTSPSPGRYFLRSTPSRLARTPGHDGNTPSHRSNASQHVGFGHPTSPSPFSRHLAQMLSDNNDGNNNFTSPSRALDFSDLPSFTTPGRMLADGDWEGLDGLLCSEWQDGGEGLYGPVQEGDVE